MEMTPDELRALADAITRAIPTANDTAKAAAYLRQQAEATDVAGLWPIAKLTVAEDGAVTASLYCPGLPPGVHEVWPCPVFAKPGVEYVPAPPFDPAHEPPWHRSDMGPAQAEAVPVAHICILPTKDAGPTKFFTAPSDPRGFAVYAHPAPAAQPAPSVIPRFHKLVTP